jgi:hypothetical protein
MVLRWSCLIGAGLLMVGLFGAFTEPQSWVVWCDLIGAWAAFFFAADITPNCSRARRISVPAVLSIGLFVTWFAAIAEKEAHWLAWWTFAFACAFLLLAGIRWIKKEEMVKVSDNSKKRAAKKVA